MTNDSAYWDDYIISNKKLIQHLIYKRCPTQPELREELLSHIWEKLLEDDRRRLKLFDPERGGNRLTYFRAVVNRLISGYFQSRFGRFRPPRALLKQNDFLLIRIYKYLCFEGMKLTDLLSYLESGMPGKSKQKHIEIEKKVAFVLEHYPDCGQPKGEEINVEEEQWHSNAPSQESYIISSHWANLFHLILYPETPLETEENGNHLHGPTLEKIKEKLCRHFTISPEKRLFLRMIYQEGMSISAAGQQLGWNKNQATGHHRRLLDKLRSLLKEEQL